MAEEIEIGKWKWQPLDALEECNTAGIGYDERAKIQQKWFDEKYMPFISFDIEREDMDVFETMFTLQHGGNGFRNKMVAVASRTYQPEKGRSLTPNFRLRLDSFGNPEVMYKSVMRLRFEPYAILVDNYAAGSYIRDGDDYGRFYRSIISKYTDYTARGYGSGPVTLKRKDELVAAFDPQTHATIKVWIPGHRDNAPWGAKDESEHEGCEICETLKAIQPSVDKANQLMLERDKRKSEYAESLESARSSVFRVPYGSNNPDLTFIPDLIDQHYKKVISTTGRKRRK